MPSGWILSSLKQMKDLFTIHLKRDLAGIRQGFLGLKGKLTKAGRGRSVSVYAHAHTQFLKGFSRNI